MTVKELRERLEALPQNMTVEIYDSGICEAYSPDTVEIVVNRDEIRVVEIS